jgi:hypothetical protein
LTRWCTTFESYSKDYAIRGPREEVSVSEVNEKRPRERRDEDRYRLGLPRPHTTGTRRCRLLRRKGNSIRGPERCPAEGALFGGVPAGHQDRELVVHVVGGHARTDNDHIGSLDGGGFMHKSILSAFTHRLMRRSLHRAGTFWDQTTKTTGRTAASRDHPSGGRTTQNNTPLLGPVCLGAQT